MKKLFENFRRFVLGEAITGSGLHDLVARNSLYDIKQKSGMDVLLSAAYISGQRNEPIVGRAREWDTFEGTKELATLWRRILE